MPAPRRVGRVAGRVGFGAAATMECANWQDDDDAAGGMAGARSGRDEWH